jgi:hypothetical protein
MGCGILNGKHWHEAIALADIVNAIVYSGSAEEKVYPDKR